MIGRRSHGGTATADRRIVLSDVAENALENENPSPPIGDGAHAERCAADVCGDDAVAVDTDETDETGDADETDDADNAEDVKDASGEPATGLRTRFSRISWSRVLAYGVLPAITVILAGFAGWAKWQDSTVRESQAAGAQAVQAASEGAVALLSYRAETVDRDLTEGRNRLTGNFRDAYTSLTHDVVIPGAKQKQISAVATVPAAALESATADHAVVLLAVDQTVIIGTEAPSATASSVRVTLDRVDGRWLISGFDPV